MIAGEQERSRPADAEGVLNFDISNDAFNLPIYMLR